MNEKNKNDEELTDNDFCDDCRTYHKGKCKYDVDGTPLISNSESEE